MEIIWIIIVGIIWGSTNVMLEKGANNSLGFKYFPEFLNTFLHPRFLVPFALNQSGSLLYYHQLGQVQLKLAVPLANSISFMVTALLSNNSAKTYIGGAFIMLGASLCVASQ
jgi:hypothetical protein